MRIGTFLFCFFLFFKISAQDGYNILYKTVANNGFGNEVFTRVVFNNFLAYMYSFPQGMKDPMEGKSNWGNKPAYHSTMIKKSTGDRFFYYGLKGYKFYWAYEPDTLRKLDWVYTSETKQIAGHPCRKAYAINEYLVPRRDTVRIWRPDSVFAWFATDIRSEYALFNCAGLPGLVMELEERASRWHIKALWLKREPIFIDEPKNIMPIEKLRSH